LCCLRGRSKFRNAIADSWSLQYVIHAALVCLQIAHWCEDNQAAWKFFIFGLQKVGI
jgi:hypothetical protein